MRTAASGSPGKALVEALQTPTASRCWRVDLVRTDSGSFALMELELIEPCLYFRFGKDAAGTFAHAICDVI